jgi:hypothetical protein
VQVVEHLIEVVLVADTLSFMPAYSRCSYDEVTCRIAKRVDAVDVRLILDVIMIEYIKGSTHASMLDLSYYQRSAVCVVAIRFI